MPMTNTTLPVFFFVRMMTPLSPPLPEGGMIITGRVPHAVLIELFTYPGAGTLIERD